MNDPMAIAKLQAAVKANDAGGYKEFAAANTALSRRVHLRGLLDFKTSGAFLHCHQGCMSWLFQIVLCVFRVNKATGSASRQHWCWFVVHLCAASSTQRMHALCEQVPGQWCTPSA